MRKGKFLANRFYSRRGFTLTEVLLAVMIVGLISVALASLTRAAARESGVGRSKIMLRNNLSVFLRTLRADLNGATQVDYVAGPLTLSTTGSARTPLLKLSKNLDASGNKLISYVREGTLMTYVNASRITYCFVRGNDSSNISPSDARRGGKIYRKEKVISNLMGTDNSYYDCSSLSDSELVLDNVKYIPYNTSSYPVPLFSVHSLSGTLTNSLLSVKVITELNTKPVVNDVVEEVFAMPMGF